MEKLEAILNNGLDNTSLSSVEFGKVIARVLLDRFGEHNIDGFEKGFEEEINTEL